MIIKEGICLVGAICESITKDVLTDIVGKKKGYKDRTCYLADNDIIEESLKTELDWVWDIRNNEHLFLLEISEHGHYKLTDYNRSIRALHSLLDKLEASFGV